MSLLARNNVLFSLRRLTIALAATVSISGLVQAQTNSASTTPWPTQPVKILIGFGPNSNTDIVARVLEAPLSAVLKQPVVIESVTGASGNIAADFVAKATDNHTVGIMASSNLTVAKLLDPQLPFNPETDFQPISFLVSTPMLLAASVNSPGNSAKEFLQKSLLAGSKWRYGSPGVGTLSHLGMEFIATKIGFKPTHIAIKGGNPAAIKALADNELEMTLITPAVAATGIENKTLKAIGVTSETRSAFLPNVPTLAEADVQGAYLDFWVGLVGPKNMPPHISQKLSEAVTQVLSSQSVRDQLAKQGWEPTTDSSARYLTRRMKADVRTLGGILLMTGANQHK